MAICTSQEVGELISSSQSITVVSHYNPDADAYGSSGGMALILKELGKDVQVINESGLLERLSFIPGIEELSDEVPADRVDLLIILDCGELSRIGDSLAPRLDGHAAKTINIDHHATNDHFADLNFVIEAASSTAELVYKIATDNKWSISAEAATALFVGISGDTGSFKFPNTSAEVLKICASLADAGASPSWVAEELYGKRSISLIRLEGEVLSNLSLHFDGQLSEAVVDEEVYERTGADPESVDQIVEKIRAIKGVKVSVFIRAHNGLWRTSLRSRGEQYDVSKIARMFGGGGHKAAAAFRWRKDLATLRSEVIKAIEEEFFS